MPKVLIADDDVELLVAISDALDDEGWTVLAATSASAALQLARSNDVDVVLADLSLAEGGEQALKEAFDAPGAITNVPFVFMTGASIRDRQLDGATVLIKPFELSEATAALDVAVHRAPRRPLAGS